MSVKLGQTVLEAAVPKQDSEAVQALSQGGAPPSNDQILDAAKAAYAEHRPAVDAATLALVASVRDGELAPALARLDGTNWSGGGVSAGVAEPFFSSREVATAIGVARTTAIRSFSVGAFTKQLPGGSPGVAGFVQDLLGGTSAAMSLRLDIFSQIVSVDPGQNLQYGVWLGLPSALHDSVLGFYANATIQGVSVNLKVLLTKTLQPYGFMSSTGATLPVDTGVFAGSTSVS